MNIKILQLIEGAKKANGLAVIIDVFRAFSVEAYIMSKGAKTIYPVGDMQIALDKKSQDKNLIIIGERGGKKIDGFDYGNSPSQIESVDFEGKTVYHTTSAGTQGIVNATNADEIITGSLVNAKAIARYIKSQNIDDVSLVCMGLRAERPIEEDTLCAKYIKSLLEDNPIDLKPEIEKLKFTSGAKFFDEKLKDVFPQRDFELCTDVNKFDFILKVEKDDDGNRYIKKIDV